MRGTCGSRRGCDRRSRARASAFSRLQLSDWRTPRSLTDRLIPGDGVIGLKAIVAAARAAGFRGAADGGDLFGRCARRLVGGRPAAGARLARSRRCAGWRRQRVEPAELPRRCRRDGGDAAPPLLHRRQGGAGAIDLRPAGAHAQADAGLRARVPGRRIGRRSDAAARARGLRPVALHAAHAGG